MKLKNIIKYLFLISTIFIISSNSFALHDQNIKDEKCGSKLISHIYDNTEKKYFYYNERRNDAGVFFDFKWDKKEKKIIIKRNKDKFPIIRYSLFDSKNFIANKTVIKKINSNDLSTLTDKELEKLTYLNGKINFELDNGKNITIASQSYKLNDFKLSNFEILSIQNIDTTKGILEMSFDAKLTNVRNDIKKLFQNNSELLDDQLHEICDDIKDVLIWPLSSVELEEFKYDADVREGLKNKEKLVNPVFQITYDNNLLRTLRTEKGVGFFRQSFDFDKFPLDTQKLIIRLKTGVGNYPNNGISTFLTPEAGVFLNLEKFLNPDINKLKAWRIKEDGIDVKSKIINENIYDIFSQKIIPRSENILDIEIIIERYYQHYLLKIMLPVFLILCVAWYVLWIPTEKYEARLNTSIIALLALIAYNFVFQDDIPKLEYLTDLDRFILLSYIFCCIPVFLSIAFSKFISKNQTKVRKINKFIKIWGAVFYLLTTAQIFYSN